MNAELEAQTDATHKKKRNLYSLHTKSRLFNVSDYGAVSTHTANMAASLVCIL